MIHIYHPNKSSSGFACSFWYSYKDNTVFATLVKQAGWDDKSQNGVFKDSFNDPNKHVNIKLSDVECSAILDCVERNRPFSSYHDNEEKPKSIQFTPWMAKASNEENNTPQQRGYSFAITVTNKQDTSFKNPFYIGLTFPEARLIREFILYSIHKRFDTISFKQKLDESPPKATQKDTSNKTDDII